MAVIVQLLNGTNLCRDAGFQSEKSAILEKGVRKGFSNELAVTTNQVATGMCFIEVTRDAVSPNEVFLVPVWITSNVTIDTSGNGYVIVRIDKSKINDGSSNELDGTDIAYVEKVTSLPASDPYIILATLASGVITDVREWAELSQYVLDNPLYFGEDSQVTDAYQVTIPGVKKYIHGKEYTFEANTTNTGAATLSVSGLAAKSIRKNFNIPLDDGDINSGQFITCRYDANNDFMQMVNPTATVVSAAGLNIYTLGTIGENVSGSDITNNNNLMYEEQSDRKWYKVTSDPLTYVNRRLALLTESANANDTNKKLLLKGIYQGKTFPATIQPTFNAAGTGNDNQVGTSVTTTILEVAQIDNTGGAEFEVSHITISAKQVGTPSGPLYLYLILQSWDTSEQVGKPCAYWDNTNNKARGAIIGETSIPQVNFSGVYQNLNIALPQNVKIPAGAIVSLCVSKGGAVNGSNYYQIQANGINLRYYSHATFQWTGSYASTPNYSLTIPASSTIGYGVKAYTGVNGSFGLTPQNPWSKIIGSVLSTTEFFFDPERNLEQADYVSYQLSETSSSESGFAKIDVGFSPGKIYVTMATWRDSTTSLSLQRKGMIRADRVEDGFGKTKFCINGNGAAATSVDNFLGVSSIGFAQSPKGLRITEFNTLHIARLENGFYVYNSYPTGSGYVNDGASGFIKKVVMFEFISKAT